MSSNVFHIRQKAYFVKTVSSIAAHGEKKISQREIRASLATKDANQNAERISSL